MSFLQKIINIFKKPAVVAKEAPIEIKSQEQFEKPVEEVPKNEEVKEEINQNPIEEEEEVTPEVDDQCNVENAVEEVVYQKITEDDKACLANIMRPIVKEYNSGSKSDIYRSAFEEIKTLKAYSSLVDEDTLLIFSFTQSDRYNKTMTEFVKNTIAKDFESEISNNSIEGFKFEVEDGKVKIRKI